MMMKYLVTLCCVFLSSCSSPRHSRIISFTPAGVVIDYTETQDLTEATDQAQRYCSSMNKDAQYVNNKEDFSLTGLGWKYTAFFNCINKHDSSSSFGSSNGANNGHHTVINNPPAVINNNNGK